MSNSEFIKVSQGDGAFQRVDVKQMKPVNNIKVVRDSESFSDTSSLSSESSGSSEEPVRSKKTKKVLRKKEPHRESQRETKHDYSMFSNPKKISQRPPESEFSESEYSSDSGSEYSDGSDQSGESGAPGPKQNSFEEKQKMKQDLLIKIAALEKKGFEFTKKFTMNSNYEEMEFEYSKIQKFIETQAGIKFARRCLMACVTGIEFLNKKFDPFNIKLEGWSENVMESVDDYDNVFEKLYEKYSKKADVAPEIELLMMLGGSAFMFHLTNSLLKGPMMSNLVAQNDPNFMASMMSAMSQGMKEQQKQPFSQQRPMFPQQQQQGVPPPMETRGIRKEMRGPNLDPNLFNGTPLANNYPAPPAPQNFSMNKGYYEENPINDDDRFSIASSESDVSSVSLGSTVKTVNVKGKKGKSPGLELNIR
jgi:hypothetical protein